jgi:predicted RNA binding protein YcfA (HicA-like mRNA interferase family)
MGQKIPSLTPRKVLKALTRKQAGFYICHTSSRGGHVHLCHPDDSTILIDIPLHPKDLKRGILHSIIKQAKLTREQFLKLL